MGVNFILFLNGCLSFINVSILILSEKVLSRLSGSLKNLWFHIDETAIVRLRLAADSDFLLYVHSCIFIVSISKSVFIICVCKNFSACFRTFRTSNFAY